MALATYAAPPTGTAPLVAYDLTALVAGGLTAREISLATGRCLRNVHRLLRSAGLLAQASDNCMRRLPG